MSQGLIAPAERSDLSCPETPGMQHRQHASLDTAGPVSEPREAGSVPDSWPCRKADPRRPLRPHRRCNRAPVTAPARASPPRSDVGHLTASAADQVVVVVAHPRLIPCRDPRLIREQPGCGESVQAVVDGLSRHVPDPFSDSARHAVGVQVVPLADRVKDRQACGGHPQPGSTQRSGVVHGSHPKKRLSGIDQENDRIHLFCCTPPNTPPRAPTFGRSVITLGNPLVHF